MNEFESLGFFDFEDFVTEMTDEQLIAVNGGACAGGGAVTPSTPSYTPHSWGTCSGGGALTPSTPVPVPSTSCGGGYNSQINKQSSFSKNLHSLVPEVGWITALFKQSSYTTNGKLTVANFGLFANKNNVSVEGYIFFGKISLVLNGRIAETKYIERPSGSNIWDGNYDYIGNVTFNSNIPSYGSVKIISDIDMIVNGAGCDFSKNETILR